MADLVIRGRALVDGSFRDAEVAVTQGRMLAVEPGGSGLVGTATIELGDDEVLIPGLVDTHVHVNEPGRTEWEGFDTATRAAAAGGVTTIIDMPLNSIPPTTTPEALGVKRAAAKGAHVDVGFWGGAIPDNLGQLRGLHDAGVFGFKCFLAPSGVDEFPHLSPAQLNAALDELAAFDGLLIVHAEAPGSLHDFAGGRHYADYEASRPDAAEVDAIGAVIAGVRRTGGRAHILHLSSAAALDELRAARAEGLRITVETCPHYLSIADDEIPDGATQYKCAPPIRGEANRDALWSALVADEIDLVVTDHSPSTVALKLAGDGDFGQAWGGIAGLQLGLRATWTEAAHRGIPLETVVGKMATATADFVGLARKGRIAAGADADLVVFAPDAEGVVRAPELQHRNPVSAYDGRTLRGEVRQTWLRGTAPGTGRLLTRGGA